MSQGNSSPPLVRSDTDGYKIVLWLGRVLRLIASVLGRIIMLPPLLRATKSAGDSIAELMRMRFRKDLEVNREQWIISVFVKISHLIFYEYLLLQYWFIGVTALVLFVTPYIFGTPPEWTVQIGDWFLALYALWSEMQGFIFFIELEHINHIGTSRLFLRLVAYFIVFVSVGITILIAIRGAYKVSNARQIKYKAEQMRSKISNNEGCEKIYREIRAYKAVCHSLGQHKNVLSEEDKDIATYLDESAVVYQEKIDEIIEVLNVLGRRDMIEKIMKIWAE